MSTILSKHQLAEGNYNTLNFSFSSPEDSIEASVNDGSIGCKFVIRKSFEGTGLIAYFVNPEISGSGKPYYNYTKLTTRQVTQLHDSIADCMKFDYLAFLEFLKTIE